MRNLFALVGFVVVLFLGLGWYLRWYQFDWATNSEGKARVQFDVDTNKVAGDLKAGADKAGAFIDAMKTKTPAEKAKRQSEDPTFVGPPTPTDWQPPNAAKSQPAAGLPGPTGFQTKR
jgi:hypothetical protein